MCGLRSFFDIREPQVEISQPEIDLSSETCLRRFRVLSEYAGGHRIRVTPVPIPNTEVKPDTADGTAWETVWESRSLPAVIPGPDRRKTVGPFFCPISDRGPSDLTPNARS